MSEKNFNIPNAISLCRLASVPVMLACVAFHREAPFSWLLLSALISDIIDGAIARLFGMTTRLGALLDSAADMGAYLSAVVGIFVLKFSFVKSYWPALTLALAFYFAEKISSFVQYRRVLNAFHTYLSKITAYAQGAFVVSLFFFGFQWYLFYPAVTICIAANIEEMIIARLLPHYATNVKGLFWVIRASKETV